MESPIPSASPAPDAVFFAAGGDTAALTDRAREAAVERAEQLLGIDPAGPELAWVHPQGAGFFATRDPADTLRYPQDHPRAGHDRYRWVDQGDGVKLGWLES